MFKIFAQHPELRYGISQKKHGFMDTKPMESKALDKEARANRQKYFKIKHFPVKIVSPLLQHGIKIVDVNSKNYTSTFQGDAFITTELNLALTITVADCFPVYIYDPNTKIIALVHAGWRGVAKKLLPKVLLQLKNEYQVDLGAVKIGIGPGIQKCHFTLDEQRAKRYFKSYPKYCKTLPEGINIDLSSILKHQAKECGIKKIESISECTFHLEEKYFSFRRDKPKVPRVMICYLFRAN